MDWHRFDNVGVCNGNDGACVCVLIEEEKKSSTRSKNANEKTHNKWTIK